MDLFGLRSTSFRQNLEKFGYLMALDTKYRPQTYFDVLGQDSSVAILRQYLKEGKGFHQSYVFCGQRGSGKTTLGRILARALLCHSPQDGIPCDLCTSCVTFLSGGTHECFVEMDAATKSTKEDMLRITEDIQYSSFSGKRKIYLFDESHRLSKQALDAILKPMEDNIPGSEDKQLVCIFCTTEPEKMQATIFSRCANAFVIKAVSPEGIAQRLAWICEQENIKADFEALVTIAEIAECHIRDALKTLEGVSVLGDATLEMVSSYLRLGSNELVLDLLEALGTDLPKAVSLVTQLAGEVSPTSAYERIAEAALCAYRTSLKVGKIPVYWKKSRVEELANRGSVLMEIASRFAVPPRRPSPQTLILDAATIHHALLSGVSLIRGSNPVVLSVRETVLEPQVKVAPVEDLPSGMMSADAPKEIKTHPPTKASGVVSVNPKAVGNGSHVRKSAIESNSEPPVNTDVLSPDVFRSLVRYHIKELTGARTGPPR